MIKEKFHKLKQLSKFISVGLVSTSIDFIIYMLLTKAVDITFAKLISTTIACIISFLFNRKWTFEYKKNINLILIVKYFISQIANIVFNVTVNTIIYNCIQVKIIAFIIATGCAMILNFVLQKYYVFRYKGELKK